MSIVPIDHRELLKTALSFVPSLVIKHLSGGVGQKESHQSIFASVLFADITGFTRLSERCAQEGPAGIGKLTRILNRCFERLVELIEAHGGDVVRFAGDALLALWEVPGPAQLSEATARAAQCGLAIQEELKVLMAEEALAMRVGIDCGVVECFHLGGERNRWEILVGGEPLRGVAQAERAAEPGQVVLTHSAGSSIATVFCKGVTIQKEGGNFWLLEGMRSALPPQPLVVRDHAHLSVKDIQGYLLRAVLERVMANQKDWLAELRGISAIFLTVPLEKLELDTLQRLSICVQKAIYEQEGSINKVIMDDHGVTWVAVMGLPPLAHEDDAERAVRASMAADQAIRALGFRPSIGIATGKAFCGAIGGKSRREYTVIGNVVNLSARLMQRGQGQILCEPFTLYPTEHIFEYQPLPPIQVKGISRPLPVYVPLSVRPKTSRPKVLFGRNREIVRLWDSYQSLFRGRSGIVLVESEPGLGKTALLEQYQQRLKRDEAEFYLVEGSLDETATPYFAWRSVLLQLLGSPVEGLKRLFEGVLPETAPLLNPVLGTDFPENKLTIQFTGTDRADATHLLVTEILRRHKPSGGYLFLLEDCQWLDSASWNLAKFFFTNLSPVQYVLFSRPTPEPLPTMKWVRESPEFQLVSLKPLDQAQTLEMIEQLLSIHPAPPDLLKLVYERTDGNPLFVTELVRVFRDHGCIKTGGDKVILDLSMFDTIPTTVEGSIGERIDRLGAGEQLTLKVCGIIGKDFTFDLLKNVYPVEEDPDELGRYLEHLHQLGFTSRLSDGSYTFSHRLIQQTASERLLDDDRVKLHGRVAMRLEIALEQAEGRPTFVVLADHWAQAKKPDKAIQYLDKASDQAYFAGAFREVVALIERARLLKGSGVEPVQWKLRLMQAHLGLGNMEACRDNATRALETLQRPLPRAGWRLQWGVAQQSLLQLFHRLFASRTSHISDSLSQEALDAAHCYEAMILVCFWATDMNGLLYAVLSGLNLTEQGPPTPELARAYAAMCAGLGLSGVTTFANSYGNLALETVKGLEDQAAKGWVLGVISLHFTGNGQWELAEKLSFEGLNIANKLGGFRLREEEAIARAYFLLFSASRHEAWEDARYLFTQMTEWAGQRGNTQFVVNGQLGLAQLSLFRNRSAEECLHRSQLLLKDVTDAQTPALFYSLLALQQYRSSSKEALETAKKAMSLCPNATPTSFLIFNGYCCLAEVFVLMALQEPSLIKEAENACGMVTRFTRSFPICRPRASVYEGWRHWLRGRKEKAVSCWERALKESEQLKMDYDQGIALHLLARHGKRPDAKEKAEAIFRRLEAVPIGVGLEEGQSH